MKNKEKPTRSGDSSSGNQDGNQRQPDSKASPSQTNTQVVLISESEIQWLTLIAEIGTGLWRVQQKMIDPGTGQPPDNVRRAYRHLESIFDTLRQAEIEIQDYTGTNYDSGLALTAIAFQPVSGIDRECIIETIKPSVYYKKGLIQRGEVIVSSPEGRSDNVASDN